MKNKLIGVILDSLTKEYNEGACDNLSKEELENLIEHLVYFKDRLEMKLDITMTTEEVSLFLNVTRLTVKNYVDLGLLHPTKQLGGVLQFKKKEVICLIDKFKNEMACKGGKKGKGGKGCK